MSYRELVEYRGACAQLLFWSVWVENFQTSPHWAANRFRNMVLPTEPPGIFHFFKWHTGDADRWMRQQLSMLAVNDENISIRFPKRLRIPRVEGRKTLLAFYD